MEVSTPTLDLDLEEAIEVHTSHFEPEESADDEPVQFTDDLVGDGPVEVIEQPAAALPIADRTITGVTLPPVETWRTSVTPRWKDSHKQVTRRTR